MQVAQPWKSRPIIGTHRRRPWSWLNYWFRASWEGIRSYLWAKMKMALSECLDLLTITIKLAIVVSVIISLLFWFFSLGFRVVALWTQPECILDGGAAALLEEHEEALDLRGAHLVKRRQKLWFVDSNHDLIPIHTFFTHYLSVVDGGRELHRLLRRRVGVEVGEHLPQLLPRAEPDLLPVKRLTER